MIVAAMQVNPAMTRALDEAIRNDLQSLQNHYSNCLIFYSIAVASGVLLERPELFHDLFELFSRHRCEKRPAWIKWIKLIGFIGWAFVVLGVIGEFGSEALVAKADELLADFNQILIAQEDALAIRALGEAYTAQQHAQTLDETAQELSAKVAQQKAHAAELDLRAVELRAANLGTEALLEAENAKRVELEAAVAPRTLPPITYGSGASIDSPLRPYAGQEAIIEFVPDYEPHRAAQQLEYLLAAAGWKVSGFTPKAEGIVDGIRVIDEGDIQGDPAYRSTIESQEVLVALLHSCKWEAHAYSTTLLGQGSHAILIQVGEKPNTYFESGMEKADAAMMKRHEAQEDAQAMKDFGFDDQACVFHDPRQE
jgi:hypothetical protein